MITRLQMISVESHLLFAGRLFTLFFYSSCFWIVFSGNGNGEIVDCIFILLGRVQNWILICG
jgi:hypothetical protein